MPRPILSSTFSSRLYVVSYSHRKTLRMIIMPSKVSDNPQTFHQALLLISSLAHLAPEAVLRNVMPIFTFMGSSVLHRDDEYSFKVVQKASTTNRLYLDVLTSPQTIDSVLPVMTSSLKAKHASSIGLHVALREFLSIFTDAANHIPRHRRIRWVHGTPVMSLSYRMGVLVSLCTLLRSSVATNSLRLSQCC